MQIIVKKLQGGQCAVEVFPTTLVSEVKRQVAQLLCIPANAQKLLFLGKTLADDQAIQAYPAIKEGSKLNLIIKKPESLHDVLCKEYKKLGMTDMQAKITANKFMKALKDKVYKLSWDDIDRLCMECLHQEEKRRLPSNNGSMIM